MHNQEVVIVWYLLIFTIMKANRLNVGLVVLAVLFFPVLSMAQAGVGISGVVTEKGTGNPVEYATVVAMHADSTVAGATVAGQDGKYSLILEEGHYLFNVSCIGYLPEVRELACSTGTVEADFSLAPSATDIGQVSVRAQRITREADRFILNVAGTLDAVGKNAEEFLKTAPAVWINEDRIMVDGRTGAQVIVNDRVLNISDEQAISYLRSINAEDIARIEIIPRAGADYDASASGGVIKITLRKRRDAGLEVSPSMRMSWGDNYYTYRPSVTVNYRTGKLAFYTRVYNDQMKGTVSLEERNTAGSTVTDSRSGVVDKDHNGGGRFGVIYDINDRQSVGAEYSYYSNNNPNIITPWTNIYSPGLISTDSSLYRQVKKSQNHYVAVNYIMRLDTLGSVFKVIGDVSRTNSTGDNLFNNTHYYFAGKNAGTSRDTLYRNDLHDKYTVATGTASLEQVLSAKSRLQAGLKFVYTSLDDDSRYYGNISGNNWELDRKYSVKQRYTEKIAAAYAVFNSSVGPVRYSLGLRGEYTHATPVISMFDGTPTEKSRNTYLSFFPNVNLSVPLQEEKGHSISAFYARKINRPGYWALNPFRMQVSEYSYIIGDPMLLPTYIDETGMSFVLFHKYTLTAGYRSVSNRIEQYVYTDPLSPDVVIYQYMNLASNDDVYLSLNLPVEITEKINLNANAYYVNQRMDPGNGGKKMSNNDLFANATMTFTLPRTYRLEVMGWYNSGGRFGNMRRKPSADMNVSVRKRFVQDQLSVAVEVRNVLEIKSKQKMYVVEEGFRRDLVQEGSWDKRSVSLSLQYNFKTGKKANGRHVERGGDDSR